MAKGERSAVFPWVALGGSSRRYWNPTTGETISRERYDSLYGSLFKRGARSFKQATAREAPEVRQTRPARGRGSRGRAETVQGISGIKPLVGRQARNVNIPFDVYYEGDESDIYEDAEDYRDGYEEAITRVQNNSRVSSVSLIVGYTNDRTGHSGHYTIYRLTDKFSLPNFDEFIETLASKLYPGDQVGPIVFHLRFFNWATRMPTKSRKALKLPKGFRKVDHTGRNR